VAYILVEDFRGGLDKRKSILTAPAGTLQLAKNCHINRGGEVEKRKAFVLQSAMPANSFGLRAVRGNLYCFGSVSEASLSPALPAGVNYQRLEHTDGATAMSALLAAENFDGKVYAIAEYADGSIFHYYDSARVTSWDSIAASVASNANVATRLAERIDIDHAYEAASVGDTVTITAAVPGTAFTYTASTVNGGSNGDEAITLVQTVANSSGVAQVVTATISGTFETADQFIVTLDGQDYTVSGGASGTGRTARTLRNKLHSTTSSLVYFCANGTPSQWGSGTGSGFINMSNQDSGSDDLTALGVYQSNLAIFSRSATQIWYIDVDPALNRQLQVLPNIGTDAPHSVTSIGESDLLFLAQTGVRSLRARDSSNNASVYDIGTPVDDLISADLALLTEAQQQAALGVIEPRDGRYWLAIADQIYVFSHFPTSKVSAWSTYEPGFSVTDFAVIGKKIYCRGDDDNYYLYGGTDGNTYGSDYEVDLILPYLAAQSPATMKEVTGIDVACDGLWTAYLGCDTAHPDERTLTHIFEGSTFGMGRLPDVGQTTHVGLRFVHQAAGYARIAAVIVHYIPEDAD